MFSYGKYRIVSVALIVLLGTMSGFAQAKKGDGTAMQRIDVLLQKLETMRRSLNSAASVLKQEGKDDKAKKDDKEKADTPLGRLNSIEKEAARLHSDANSLRGKVDRAEKYEPGDVDQLEQAVSELQSRVDTAQLETAQARANPGSDVGKPRDVKKKK